MSNPLFDFVERLRAQDPIYDWQPTIEPPTGYERRLKSCDAPELSLGIGSIEDARKRILNTIWDYLDIADPSHILLIKTLPGTGKTTAAVMVIDELVKAGKRIEYAGPRHDLYKDVLSKSSRPDQWYEWLPRQTEDEDTGKIQTCLHTDAINQWMQKGYKGIDFCSGVCGWEYIKNGCVYHAQKRRMEKAIYTQHQHVTLGHPLVFDALIGDESPITAFTHEWRIPARFILPPGMDPLEPITEILSYLGTIASQTEKSIEGPQLLDLLGGAEGIHTACNLFQIPLNELAAAMSIHNPEEVRNKPYFHLFDLIPLLKRESDLAMKGISYPHRIILSPGFLILLLRRKPDWRRLPSHVIWLDATGKEKIYRSLFGRDIQVVDARPRLQGKVYQVVDRANGKTALLGKENSPSNKASQAKQLIDAIISSRGYINPSIITFKGLVDIFDDQRMGHFYAARGTNDHEDADSIFILGSPQPNIYDVVRLAKMIFFERDQSFHVHWCMQERVYPYIHPDGQGRSYPISGFWNDPDLQVILEALREDEILQAAHRGRPVNHPVDIWLLTNIPLDELPPDELLTMREVLGAPLGVNIFLWEQVLRLAETKNEIFLSDLIGLGISKNTAAKYLDALISQGWELGARKPGDRSEGRTRKYIRKTA